MAKNILKYPIRLRRLLQAVPAIVTLFCMSNIAHAQQQEMIVRISEIEIHPQYLEEYKIILKHEAEASVRLEAGVIAIFPMYQKDHPAQIRILEMYKDPKAYQAHLKTEHFQKYKTGTLHMVKSLKLVDMEPMDLEAAPVIFKKLKGH